MILKHSLFFCFFFISNIYAIDVLVAKNPIKFEEEITIDKLVQKQLSVMPKRCKQITQEDISYGKFVATHFINKGAIVCTKDIKKVEYTGVLFNFGGFIIEKKGKIIYENDTFIRFRNQDGKIEQIFKDGRLK